MATLPALVPLLLAGMHVAPVLFPNHQVAQDGPVLEDKPLFSFSSNFGWTEPFDPDKVFVTVLAACLLAIIGQLKLALLSWGLVVPCVLVFGLHFVQTARPSSRNTARADGTLARLARSALTQEIFRQGARSGTPLAITRDEVQTIKT